MVLTEKETQVINDLKTQEQTCIDRYDKFSKEAKDTELRALFERLRDKEKEHFETLTKILNGEIPNCDVNDYDGKKYNPKARYKESGEEPDKKADCFLLTDAIGSEKLASSEYNSNVFVFGDSDIRKILADIMVEEQNHAEMLYKYKTVNGMK